MNKKRSAVWKIVIIIAVVIAVILVFIFLVKPGLNFKSETNETGKPKKEIKVPVILNDPICNELVLNIEKVECEYGKKELLITIFRREDSLGQGSLIVNATDKENVPWMLIKLNFTSGSAEMNMYNTVAGNETFVTTKLELDRNGKIISCNGANLTYECKKGEGNETSALVGLFPNPTGSVKAVDIAGNEGEGYFCNANISPKHGVRVYTYKNINNTEVLSEKYVEGMKEKVCDAYPDISNGIWYDIRWEWQEIEDIDGYKIFQYYELGNIKREYDYSIRLLKVNKLTDNGLELWKKEA